MRPTRRLRRLLRRRPRAVLVAYWIAAFVATHSPPLFGDDDGPPAFEPPVGADKIFHFVGFAVLAFLLRNAGLGVVATLALCLAYGAFDELTQPPFGRTADPFDLMADLLGATAGIAASALHARRHP